MGLYPAGTGPKLGDSNTDALPNGFQPIPVHTIPKDQDYLLRSHDLCGKYFELVDQVEATEEWAKKQEENQEFLDELSALFYGKTITLSNLDRMFRALVCVEAH
jgi:hypothetical protein